MVEITNNYCNVIISDIMEITIITKFYIIYHNLLDTRDENEYILLLSKLTKEMTVNEFNKIKHIKNLIFKLEKEKLMLSYKMSLLVYVKYNIINNLTKFFQDIQNTENILDKIELLKKYNVYMKSYKPLPLKITKFIEIGSFSPLKDNSDQEDTDNDEKENDSCKAWYLETRLEIINRLTYLRNYFGLEMLQKFKIKNITYEEVCNMNYEKICKYYNKVIQRIKREVEKNIQLCDAYIEVERQFVESLFTSNSNLELENFSLVVEGNNDEINENINNDDINENDDDKLDEEL